jgi:hypothetical protein
MSLWLVSPRFDLSVFLLPAVIALLLVPLGPVLAPGGDTPFPMWIACVLLIDVAHVWSTLFRTYLDREELARRPLLYTAAPIAAFLFALASSAISMAAFWTALAYLAVFHFVRQQYGWVALYNRKDTTLLPIDRFIDSAAIYAATLYPILWWHAHLPRRFDWFVAGDFARDLVAPSIAAALMPAYVAALAVFGLRQLQRRLNGEPFRVGKMVVVATTALCWGTGIIVTNSDWAFTVTNVIIHGVPYFGFIWFEREKKRHAALREVVLAYLLLVVLASLEELGWHRSPDLPLFVAALALPQTTHYLLDGFIWKKSYG